MKVVFEQNLINISIKNVYCKIFDYTKYYIYTIGYMQLKDQTTRIQFEKI